MQILIDFSLNLPKIFSKTVSFHLKNEYLILQFCKKIAKIAKYDSHKNKFHHKYLTRS